MIWPLCNSLSSYFCERILNRTHHNTSDSLKASVVAGIADIEATRESKVLLGYRWWSAPFCNPLNIFLSRREDHQKDPPWHSLKASMVAIFADMINAPGARRRLRSPSPTTALKSSTSPRRRLASAIFFFILFYILFSCNTKKSSWYLYFECVREKLFLSRFTVTTLYLLRNWTSLY